MALQDEIHEFLNDKITDIFDELHSKYNTISGDIDLDQEMLLSELTEKMAELMSNQISQNMSDDANPEIDKLRELSGI